MSEAPDRDGMLPEYDFSEGVRGKYVSRLAENRAELLEQAGIMDRQAWVARALMAVQDFESRLVAYWSLVHGQDAEAAGRMASSLLEGHGARWIESLRNDVGDDFDAQLRPLLADRNWLVHRSFRGFSASRLQSIAERSAWLSDRLWSALLERCRSQGIDADDAEARAEEVVERWATSRSAA